MEKTGRSRDMGTPGTLIYVTFLLKKGLRSTKCPVHTVAQNICLHIILLNPYKDPYSQHFLI